jgi:N-formylglutamate deformylase
MILHIPHSSRLVPSKVRGQFVISDEELELELTRMTDAYTDEIFMAEGETVVK